MEDTAAKTLADDAVESVRLSVNVNLETAAVVRDYMNHHSVSATETVRRAISVLKYLDDEQREGREILSVKPAGPYRFRKLMLPS